MSLTTEINPKEVLKKNIGTFILVIGFKYIKISVMAAHPLFSQSSYIPGASTLLKFYGSGIQQWLSVRECTRQ